MKGVWRLDSHGSGWSTAQTAEAVEAAKVADTCRRLQHLGDFTGLGLFEIPLLATWRPPADHGLGLGRNRHSLRDLSVFLRCLAMGCAAQTGGFPLFRIVPPIGVRRLIRE